VQFPGLDDLGLATITAPTLLVHGSADSDVAPEYSERAVDAIAGAELHAVKGGTHLATWTRPAPESSAASSTTSAAAPEADGRGRRQGAGD
jgi:pimeloyl-ACP methyl ester carboxylesterase